MKNAGKMVALAAIICFALALRAQEASPWQTLRAMRQAARFGALEHQGMSTQLYRFAPSSIRASSQLLEFDAKDKKGISKHFVIPIADLNPVIDFYHQVNFSRFHRLIVHSTGDKTDYFIQFVSYLPECQQAESAQACQSICQKFVDGLNSFRISAPKLAMSDFEQKASAWRTLAVKPDISADIKLRRSLAENAVKSGKPAEALNYYELGALLDPTWAQGWFNAAVVAAQLEDYVDAVEHMQKYVLLMPDTADADSAREQIAMWRYKMQEK